MKIEYYGHSCFRITAKNGTSIITDPYTRVGYELPQGLCADVVTVSHGHFDHNAVERIFAQKTVDCTGVHASDGLTIQGIAAWHDEKNGALRGNNIIYKWEIDGLNVCHFGDLGESVRDALLNEIGSVDVLLIPIGGTYTIDAKQAYEYVRALAPAIVIPMHYRPKDGAIDITDEQPFLRMFDSVERVGREPITIEEGAINTGKTRVIFMERICR